MKNHGNGHPVKDDFIAPARRAFLRVAMKLRVENQRLGLPLVVASGNHLNGPCLRVNSTVNGAKNLKAL